MINELLHSEAWDKITKAHANNFNTPIIITNELGQILKKEGTPSFLSQILLKKHQPTYEQHFSHAIKGLKVHDQSSGFFRGPDGLLYALFLLEQNSQLAGSLILGLVKDTNEVPVSFKPLTEQSDLEEDELLDEFKKLPLTPKEELLTLKKVGQSLTDLFFFICKKERKHQSKSLMFDRLKEVEGIFAEANSFLSLLKNVALYLKQVFHFSCCTITLFREQSSTTEGTLPEHKRINQLMDYIKNNAMRTNHFVVIKSLKTDPMLSFLEERTDLDMGVLGIPLTLNNNCFGVISCFAEENRSYSEQDLSFLLNLTKKFSQAYKKISSLSQAEHNASTDKLTGLNNRAFFQTTLENTVTKQRENNNPTTLMMFDIDDFKAVNDTFGHQKGDEVLKEVAQITKQTIKEKGHKKSAIASRYGGEEFTIILKNNSQEIATELAESVRKNIADHNFPLERQITISLGLIFARGSSMSPTDMISVADKNLYKAKASGKNKVISSIVVSKGLAPINIDEVKEHHKERDQKKDNQIKTNEEDTQTNQNNNQKENSSR